MFRGKTIERRWSTNESYHLPIYTVCIIQLRLVRTLRDLQFRTIEADCAFLLPCHPQQTSALALTYCPAHLPFDLQKRHCGNSAEEEESAIELLHIRQGLVLLVLGNETVRNYG